MNWAVLGSGSNANSYYFQHQDFAFVIDNGFSLKQWLLRAQAAGVDPGSVQFIFLTHAHSDHIKGVGALSQYLKVPVVIHEGLKPSLLFPTPAYDLLTISWLKSYQFGPLDFYAFPLEHDSPMAMSFHFKLGEKKCTLLTDTGTIDDRMRHLVLRSHLLFLESNYCPQMLETGPYPPYLKARVRGEKGHLSNTQALAFLDSLSQEPDLLLEKSYLVHLSKNNNSADRILELLSGRSYPFSVKVCARGETIKKELLRIPNPGYKE